MKKFRRTPWRFQQTFQTPRKMLSEFTSAIGVCIGELSGGTVVIDSIVFPPKNLGALLRDRELLLELGPNATLLAETSDEIQPLLAAAFGDWVDFALCRHRSLS